MADRHTTIPDPISPDIGERDGWNGHGRTAHARDREPAVGLLVGLAQDLTTLVRQEAELVRVELSEKVDEVQSGVKAFSAGALLLYAGAILVLVASALALDQWIQKPWVSFLIVGAVVALIGSALIGRARQKLDAANLAPRRTADAVRRDAQMLRNAARD